MIKCEAHYSQWDQLCVKYGLSVYTRALFNPHSVWNHCVSILAVCIIHVGTLCGESLLYAFSGWSTKRVLFVNGTKISENAQFFFVDVCLLLS